MSKGSLFLILLLNFALAAIPFQWASAQVANDANRFYGEGVHAYFAGNSTQAESCLSSALELNTDDPRYYYFRALALLRMGRTDEARGDMLLGAQLETQHPGRFAVGTALERVQGADRLMLERFRREARAEAGLSNVRPNRTPAKLQPTTDRDSAVLRRKLMVPLDQFLQPGGPQPVVDDRATPATPPQPTFAPATKPAQTVTGPEDPFRDDPRPQPNLQPSETAAPKTVPSAITPPPTSPPAESEQPPAEPPAPKTPPATPPVDGGNPFDF